MLMLTSVRDRFDLALLRGREILDHAHTRPIWTDSPQARAPLALRKLILAKVAVDLAGVPLVFTKSRLLPPPLREYFASFRHPFC